MEDEPRLGKWSVHLSPGQNPVIRDEESGKDIAALLSDDLRTALLIAKAPSLRDAVKAAVAVFTVMVERGTEREREIGNDMLPSMLAALYGIEDDEP